jgi:hypothetical protein
MGIKTGQKDPRAKDPRLPLQKQSKANQLPRAEARCCQTFKYQILRRGVICYASTVRAKNY